MEFIIRNVEEKDLRQIAEINVEDWKIFFKGIIDDEFLDSLSAEAKEKRWLANYKENSFIVAANGDEVYGYCKYADVSYGLPDEENVDSELCSIYVKASLVKGNGIGRALVEYVKNDLKSRGRKKMIICCLEENYRARAFYEKMGGKYYGEKDYEAGGKIYNEVIYIYDLI